MRLNKSFLLLGQFTHLNDPFSKEAPMYDMTYTIHGTSMEIVEFSLFPGQFIQAEIGSMIYMGDSMEMKTGTGGGIWKGLKRKLAGERFLVSQFKNR